MVQPKPSGLATVVELQVMLPVSFLIFLAVWLVLLPAAYQTSGSDMGLLSWPALFSHNLNFVFMFVEALVNKLCITTYHLIFIFYYGALYVIFSWIFFSFYHFFFYFFIDWRNSGVLIGDLARGDLNCSAEKPWSVWNVFLFLGPQKVAKMDP